MNGDQTAEELDTLREETCNGRMIIIQNNTSKVEYAYLVVVVECVHMGGVACQYLSCTQC